MLENVPCVCMSTSKNNIIRFRLNLHTKNIEIERWPKLHWRLRL